MKKCLCVIISFILLISCNAPMLAFADIKTNEEKISLLQEGNLSYAEDVYMSSSSLNEDNIEKAKNAIYNGLLNIEKDISLSSYKIPVSTFALICANVINDNPDLFYVSSNVKYKYDKTQIVTNFIPDYVLSSKKEIEAEKEKFDKEVDTIISKTDDSMNDLQKALIVHDYICDHAIYPNINNYGDKPIYHSAYGFVKDRNIVCAGYTLFYSAVLNKLNIPSKYIISKQMGHAWNAVYIEGCWYNVDLTWDDSGYNNSGENNMGNFSHEFFMKSDSNFNNNEHYDISYPDGLSCTDTTYDSSFWDNNISNIYVYNGDYYYFDCDSSNYTVYIVKRDKQGNTTKVSKDLYYSALSVYSSFSYPCGQFTKINNTLYFTTFTTGEVSSIYSYNLITGDENKFGEFEGASVGLGEIDGNIAYATYENSQNYISIDRKPFFNNSYPASRDSSDYNAYADLNDDGYINAKDYVQIKK